jgi:succinate dehydrogenase / fumarate reductase membrane anchor subunit
MVKSVSGLTGSGIKDFLVQRFTAYVLLIYVLIFIVYSYTYGPLDYTAWKAMWSWTPIKVGTLLSCLCLIGHAWVGMWTVFTDYIHCAWLRGSLMLAMVLSFVAYFLWTVQILWS